MKEIRNDRINNRIVNNKNKLLLVTLCVIIVLNVLTACLSSKEQKENKENDVAERITYRQSELNFENAEAKLEDIKEYDITEVRVTTADKSYGNISGTFDSQIIANAKELVAMIKINEEPYEIDSDVDGGIHESIWFLNGKDVVYVLTNDLGEIKVNGVSYGLDKGEFGKLMQYIYSREAQAKFEVIE